MADKRIIEVDDYQHGLILNALNDKRNEPDFERFERQAE